MSSGKISPHFISSPGSSSLSQSAVSPPPPTPLCVFTYLQAPFGSLFLPNSEMKILVQAATWTGEDELSAVTLPELQKLRNSPGFILTFPVKSRFS